MSEFTSMHGFSRQALREGPVRKGGINPAVSQVQTRPPPPAPLRPAPQDAPALPAASGLPPSAGQQP